MAEGREGEDPDLLASPRRGHRGFSGLYEFWRDPEVPDGEPGEWLMTTTILTRPAADTLGHIHDRTPVMVPADLHDEWLAPGLTDKGDIRTLLEGIPDPELVPREVGKAVGNVRNNGPELCESRTGN